MTTSWRVRGRTLSTERPLVMGIVNLTPDSFSDGGALPTVDAALARAETLVREGADILDVGGESTRPRAEAVEAEEELQRVLPFLRELANRFPEVPVSIDTVKSRVALAAIEAGARIVNDVSGFRLDPAMARTCAQTRVGVVLMHSRGSVDDMATYAHAEYDGDPMDAVLSELRERVDDAIAQGVARECIVVDPGIGFSKMPVHSVRVLGTLPRLARLGFPVMVGASRKRFVGELTGMREAATRVFGSVGAAVAAYDRGARILRVHDVAATRQALDVADAIRRAGGVMNELAQLRLVHPGWRDVVEVLVVAYALYRVLRLFHGTRTLQIVTGMAMLLMVYAAAWLLKLDMITYLLGFVFQYGAIALLVVFAPELRAALAHLGQARFAGLFRQMEQREVAEEICEAVERLSRSGIGAIVAIEREVPLDGYAESGSPMEARVSADLLTTIFTPYSPLHDGAVLIRGDTIVSAGCILPLSQKSIGDRTLGTRHRAALGLSDESDALVIVVSEERSTMSIADRGQLWVDLTPVEVREMMAGRAPERGGLQSAGVPV